MNKNPNQSEQASKNISMLFNPNLTLKEKQNNLIEEIFR